MPQKLKIITTSLRYPPAPGGAEKVAEQVTLGMVRKGHQVKVYTSNLKCHSTPEVSWLKPWEYRDDPPYVTRCRASYFDQVPYPYMHGMFGKILKEKKGDLIHAHNFYYYPADLAYLAAKLKRTPFFFHPYFYYPSREARKWKYYRKTIGRLTMRADCIFALTEYEKKVILNFFRPKRIEVIPPGIERVFCQKTPFNIYTKIGLPQDRRIILFVGRICYGKGVDTLIRAYAKVSKKHPGTILALAGSDFGDQRKFEKMATALRVEKNIVWLGELSIEKLASAYQNATLFCLPTLYENFGLVLVEAMAAGLPIVSTDYSAVPYVVPKDKAGFLTKKGDHKHFADYMDKILKNPKLAQSMGEAGRREAKKYTWQKMANQIEKIYHDQLK